MKRCPYCNKNKIDTTNGQIICSECAKYLGV